MRLPTRRRGLLALLLALSAAAVALDLSLRQSLERSVPRASTSRVHVRRSRGLSFLRTPSEALADSVRGIRQRIADLDVPGDADVARDADVIGDAQQPPTRGVVLPLDADDAALGASLVLSLRTLGRDAAAVPVEFAHCGEAVPRALRLSLAALPPLGPTRFVDVCAAAARKGLLSDDEPLGDGSAGPRLRGRALRLAAVAFSELDELLLLDAAALLLQDPTPLLDAAAFRSTGALFFSAAPRVAPPSAPSDASASASASAAASAARFDSTLAVWSRRSQRRATAALAAQLPSLGRSDADADAAAVGSSELLAAAATRAGGALAVWGLAAGVVGALAGGGRGGGDVALCGALAQFAAPPGESPARLWSAPPASAASRRPRPLVLGGRAVLEALVGPDAPALIVYTASVGRGGLARRADGRECAAVASRGSVAGVAALSKRELERVARRQQQHRHALDWLASVADWSVREAARAGGPLADVVRARAAQLAASDEQLVYSLDRLAQRATRARGLVLPLFDAIAPLGGSLVLELRELGLDLPVEIAHCGDLSPRRARALSALLNAPGRGQSHGGGGDRDVRVYDVCAEAARERSALSPSRKLFCRSLAECHRRFRGFDIKVLALALSRFADVLLLDADTLFFSSPAALFDSAKFRDSGTLFFHDRISGDRAFMARRLASDARRTAFHDYMLAADVSRLAAVPTLARELATDAALHAHGGPVASASASASALVPDPGELPFAPSAFLLASHSWNARAGFQMDSSCVLWSKRRQPRATALLAAFVARNDVDPPPSYGDKELFFVACELAEARYAFSDWGIGAVGTYVVDRGPDRSVLCGDMSHNLPEWTPDGEHDHAPLLYINSDNILAFRPDETPVFYSKPRPAELYPGPFPWQQECPFNVTAVPFSAAERARVYRRQRLHADVLEWLDRSSAS